MNYPTMTNEQHTAYLMGDMELIGDDLPEEQNPFFLDTGVYDDWPEEDFAPWSAEIQALYEAALRECDPSELPF